MVLQPEAETPFPWLALITPGALFLLMALFWMQDARYSLFSPIYLAGKGFGIVTFTLWLFFTGNGMMGRLFYSKLAWFTVPGAVLFLLLGDALSVWTVIIIMKNKKNSDN